MAIRSLKNLFEGKRRYYWIFIFLVFLLSLSFNYTATRIGRFLIEDNQNQPYKIAVILAGDYYERFLELYERVDVGEIEEIFITLEEKDDTRLKFEKIAGPLPTPSELTKKVMMEKGIPEEKIIIIPGAVRSTRDEAIFVGNYMRKSGIKGIAVITSKYHSHRACTIMRVINPDLDFSCIASRYDDFNPDNWWKGRRSIMKVVSEYVKWLGYEIEFIFNRKLAQ